MATWYGFNAPFIGGAQNFLSRQEDERLIKNDMIQLLLTAPGERVMRPTFGSPIRPFLFENMEQNEVDSLEQQIRVSIARIENRVTLKDIKLNAGDNNVLTITVLFSLNSNPLRDLEVVVTAPGRKRNLDGNIL